jgi:hypothetical protein
METTNLLNTMASGMNNVNKIKRQFFNVILEPARVSNPSLEQPQDTYFVYNENSGKQIAKKSVGKDFEPMQQQEFLDNILLTIRDFKAKLDLDSLTFRRYCNDSKIEFSIKTMHPLKFKNFANINDQTNIELVFSTSYDGTKSNRISLFTHRLMCKNGMTVRKKGGELKGRNTLGGKIKILSYAEEVASIIKGVKDYKKEMLRLNKKKITKAQIEEFKLKLFGYNAASLENDKKSASQIAKPMQLLNNFDLAMGVEFPRCGQTAYGLLQAVTYYTNHIANENGRVYSNNEFIRYGTGEKVNDKAQELIYAMLDKPKPKRVKQLQTV